MLQRLSQCWLRELAIKLLTSIFEAVGSGKVAGVVFVRLPTGCCSRLLPESLSHLPAAGTAWRCMPELACWLTQTASGRCWLRYCLPPRRELQFVSSGDPGLNHTP